MGRTFSPIFPNESAPDHPHAGGENNRGTTWIIPALGPSPRGWGELTAVADSVATARTIPTRVGRTAPINVPFRRNPDHPHAGGENQATPTSGASHRGPSPRGWGEPETWLYDRYSVRTIPTRVGRTRIRECYHAPSTDHPHAGGENVIVCNLRRRLPWTIPTRVGRTRCCVRSFCTSPDHPHAGGENKYFTFVLRSVDGPSPRGWGEPHPVPSPCLVHRTIPTRVGRTGSKGRLSRSIPDHPHAGGENKPGGDDYSVMIWTIPTRVGRTLLRSLFSLEPPDHPHAGGENLEEEGEEFAFHGPSPRGWGERHHLRCPWPSGRTIPTRVGRTHETHK